MMRNSVVRRRKSAGSRRVRAASQAVAVMDILERRTLFTALAVWNFNDAAASTSTSALLTVDRVTPGITAGMTTTLTGSAFTVFTTGTQVNADSGDANGSAMGIVGTASNNGSITFTTTTTGYNGVSVSFASQRTTTGANSDQFQYSTDGTTFTNFGAVYTPPAAYAVQSFDLSSVSGLNNNPNAAFRIIFNGASSTSGNNRIDNLIVAGTALPIPTQPLAFNAPSTSVPESAGTVTLTVTRGPANNTDLSGDETVTYSTANGTATAGTNYNATTGTVVFHSGDTSKTITVPVLDAPNMGGNKTFTVTLSNPTLANGSSGVTATLGPQSTTTVTILDTTETFALTSSAFTASDVLNPSAGTPGAAIVSISRSGYTGDAATVNYATVNGSAIAGTDYTATSGTLNFAANQSVGYFSVPVNDLTTTKAFGVTLSTPTAQPGDFTALGTAAATTTIVNVAQINPTLTGGASSSVNIETSGPFTSNFAVLNGDQTGTSSFAFLAYPLLSFDKTTTPGLYPAGSSTVTSLNGLSLQLYNTAISGSFAGHPGNVNVYFIADTTTATSALTYDTTKPDGFNAAQFSATSALVNIGSFSFVSSNVGYETYGTTNLSSAAQTAIIAALNGGKAFRLAITPDGTGIGATAADYTGVSGSPTTPPILSFSGVTTLQVESFNLASASVTANRNDSSVVITVDRSTVAPGDLSDTASVLLSTVNGTAVSGTDFTGGNYLANFASGATATTVSIPLLYASSSFGDKAFSINLSSPAVAGAGRTGALVAPTAESVTLRDTRTTNISGAAALVATVQTTGPRANAGTVVANNFFNVDGAQATDPSYGVADFEDANDDPDHTYFFNVPSGQTVGTINTLSIGLVNAPQSGVSKNGTFNVYLVDDSNTSIANTGGSPLTFNTSADAVEGLGSQLSTKHLLGSFAYNTNQSSAAFTYFPLTSIDSTTKGLLVADLNNQTKFRLVVTPADSPSTSEAGTFRGLATFNGLYEAPTLAINYTPPSVGLPAYLDPNSVATYDSGSNTVTVTGPTTIIADPGSSTVARFFAGGSAAIVTVNLSSGSQLHLTSLHLSNGASAVINNGLNGPILATIGGSGLASDNLTIDVTSKLDIKSSDVIAYNQYDELLTDVKTGFNLAGGGNWSGPGIVSSVAATDSTHTMAVGVVFNTIGFTNGGTTPVRLYGAGTTLGLFDGADPLAGLTLIKFTYFGDANIDGKVDGSDYSRIDSGFLTSGSTGWYNGDFNYDGKVDGSDYSLIDNAYNRQGARRVITPSALLAQSSVLSSATFSDKIIKTDKKDAVSLFDGLAFDAT